MSKSKVAAGISKVWLVRAGRHGEDEETALNHGIAIIGFREVGDLAPFRLARGFDRTRFTRRSPRDESNARRIEGASCGPSERRAERRRRRPSARDPFRSDRAWSCDQSIPIPARSGEEAAYAGSDMGAAGRSPNLVPARPPIFLRGIHDRVPHHPERCRASGGRRDRKGGPIPGTRRCRQSQSMLPTR